MCSFLQLEYNERCYMSAELLVKNTIYFDTETKVASDLEDFSSSTSSSVFLTLSTAGDGRFFTFFYCVLI